MKQSENPFALRESKEVYKNPWIQVREDTVVRPGGTEGIFGVITMQSGVTVVALTLDNQILLAEEYKYAVGRVTLECISGGIDRQEDMLDSAKRELKEETGGVSDDWTYLGVIDPLTTILTGENHMFLARGVSLDHEQSLDAGEIVKVRRVPFAEALEKVFASEITHGASVAAILRCHILMGKK
jgi:8-oxo-dGTP pyrophosphatase MutT (NUDIX family)